MKIYVICDSKTGNTRMLEEVIRQRYAGNITENPQEADVVFMGSWTDKGNCSEKVSNAVKEIKGKKVFIFGTCGFGGSEDYYEQLFRRAAALLDDSNEIIGHFYCQGKMPMGVRNRYVAMLREHPDDKNMQVSLDNFDRALSHPDKQDLEKLSSVLETLKI